MKSLALRLVLLSFVVLLFSCSQEDDGIYFDETSTQMDQPVSYSKIELDILKLVNNHRTSIGLSELKTLDIVSSVAGSHTEYMIENDKLSHDNFSKRAQALMNNANAKSVSENVAYGYTTAENVLKGWLNSTAHKTVIENPNFTHFGICTEANEKHRNYFTHIFIKK